ncbi:MULTISPECIES: hypothetical protein [Butyricimonas]|jgi:hypothetical protein|uniref:Uncharacterized protein n=1 Tax=Butyricimonas faecihominis TaxID=1472416 RepID=A0A7W6N030_9BACT|nr:MULTISPECIES: hypothetical protein [Butyricimonas]MBS6686900.1 hypothetical protein [Sanguibacteroides justesenii]OKZ16367.1 MAG: hypothetical protein BHV81_13045 [Butyricimonas synergistica]KAB1505265.1 hypothetical protein F8R21_14700 [Butyricimonas faecihominis]MBB4027589.1 hypothetical protein [Butyricimonas faecihominis]WOF08776.1 hypothetical protein F1611_10405 [Butyricimonas faecihominis]
MGQIVYFCGGDVVNKLHYGKRSFGEQGFRGVVFSEYDGLGENFICLAYSIGNNGMEYCVLNQKKKKIKYRVA